MLNDVKRAPSADAARLGEPSYVWRSGQERRLQLIRRYVPLEDRRILDVGCGIGTYVRRFRDFSPRVYGLDVSAERLAQAGLPNLVAAEGENLPFADASFDVLVFNEVIEHVRDDRQAIRDALRVLRDGGHVVIYAPKQSSFGKEIEIKTQDTAQAEDQRLDSPARASRKIAIDLLQQHQQPDNHQQLREEQPAPEIRYKNGRQAHHQGTRKDSLCRLLYPA